MTLRESVEVVVVGGGHAGLLLGATLAARGALAEWLRSGLQSRLHRFDSGRRLSLEPQSQAWQRSHGMNPLAALLAPERLRLVVVG